LESWKEWRTSHPAKIPLSIANKETLYPNGINFSCVFPAFNQYEIVRKTLAGLAKQKIRSDFQFECIMVDNNSTDDIQQIYMDYRDKLDLRLIQRRKLENTFSVPSARNMGILEAKYDFIVGMDSDVIFDEYALENLYKFLSSRDESTPYIVTAERYFVATDDFVDSDIMEDFSTCEKFPPSFPRPTTLSLATIAFRTAMSCTMSAKMCIPTRTTTACTLPFLAKFGKRLVDTMKRTMDGGDMMISTLPTK
jgi:cellulose synthase/poly-beta-1,6-N-acetylglucosamine synthase-like glycosyltransferase